MIRALAPALLLCATAASAQQVKAPWPATLSVQARAGLAANEARPPEPAGMPERRARADAIQREIGLPRLKRYGVTMTDGEIAGVPVRIFTPRGERANAPLLLNLHGGGFIVDSGSITENAAVAGLTGYRVIAVRYRLSPEHPFPAALEDSLAVYHALLKQRPGSRIGLYGTSAGAILSAQLVARLRADRLPLPAAYGFFSGSADLSNMGDSVTLFADPALAGMVVKIYATTRDPADPALSPLRGDLKGWPATLCLASGRDFLLSGTTDFCRALEDAGVDARLTVFDGLPHAFWSYIDAPETDAAFATVARFFTNRLEKAK